MPLTPEQQQQLVEAARTATLAHAQVESGIRTTMTAAKKAGDALRFAKSLLARGTFLAWLDDTVSFSRSTAQAYMKISANWEDIKDSPNLTAALRALGKRAADVPPPPEVGDPEEEEQEDAYRLSLMAELAEIVVRHGLDAAQTAAIAEVLLDPDVKRVQKMLAVVGLE